MKHIKTFESFLNEAVKQKEFEIEIINKNGTKTTQKVSVDPGTTELFTIVAYLKKSPNVKDVHIIDESTTTGIDESADYVLKDDSGEGRPTMVLKLGPVSWEKVKHLFDDQGRPESDEIKKIVAAGSKWTLYASEYSQDGKVMHKIYGASGDYTFGNAPTFYQQKYRGNKKAAKEVFDIFVNKYLK